MRHETHVVTFTGAPSRRGPATWGQQFNRTRIEALGAEGHRYNIVLGGPALEPPPVRSALKMLHELLLAHEVLRTTWHEGAGGLQQVVQAEGRVKVLDCGVENPEDAEQVTESLRGSLRTRLFDSERELPIRCAFVTHGERVLHTIVVVSHLALDGVSAQLLTTEIQGLGRLKEGDQSHDVERLGRRGSIDGPSVRWQPIDEAEYQCSPEGARQDERVRERLITRITAAGSPILRARRRPRNGRFERLVLRSSRLKLAAAAISVAHGMTPATTLLAAAATSFAAATGRDSVAMRILVSNRFRPELAQLMSPVAMDTLFALGEIRPESDFLTTAKRAWKAAMIAYRSAYYNPTLLHEQLSNADSIVFDEALRYNDHLGVGADSWDRWPDASDGVVAWSPSPSLQPDGRALYLHVHDSGDAIVLELIADTGRIEAETAERLLYRIVESVESAASAAEHHQDQNPHQPDRAHQPRSTQ
ncbi:condensation domain-containing protein [Pseudoclavibacter sp. AY1F1]|uniref:condensation domain-containing protein n=1 Tax=Pseudoclavibacter sp. AY1F1 TaxID=2080583 RepID=UPI0015E2F4DC|nr:condensation domain-containing protein [Pseudoclavibacter sp. AY1F1]